MPRNSNGTYSLPADSGLLPKDPHTQIWNRAAFADIASAFGQAAKPGCLLLLTSGQAITSGVNTAFSWQTSSYNNYSLWAASPTPSRITIPTGITWIRLTAAYYNSALTAAASLWPLFFFILKNADNFIGAPVFASLIDPGTTIHGVTIATPWVTVTTGDYFEVYLNQTSTFAQTFGDSADNRMRTWFACEVLEG